MSDDLKQDFVVTLLFKDEEDGFHLLAKIDGKQYFDRTYETPEERQWAHDELLERGLSLGAVIVPKGGH